MRKARGRVLRVADGDLLEILNTPEIAILAHGAQVEVSVLVKGQRLPIFGHPGSERWRVAKAFA